MLSRAFLVSPFVFPFFGALAFGQVFTQPDGRVPLPTDWSTKHVIYTQGFTAKQAVNMRNDPRLYYSWLRQGHFQTSAATAPAVVTNAEVLEASKNKKPAPAPHRDWAFSLGNGTVAENMSPGKWSFDVNATPSCSNDFAVYGLNVAGTTSGQANLVALNNLYSGSNPTGTCGAAPTVYWAYNVTTKTGGTVATSPSISEDGQKIIFVESYGSGSILHILRWNSADGGTVAASKAPTNTATALSSCPATASCLVSITLGSSTNTNSSPFYDYNDDTVYVGDDGGMLYKITPVLNSGTPVVTKLSSALGSGTKLTGPVYDSNSGLVFVGGANGVMYAVTASSLTLASHSSLQVGDASCSSGNNALADPPIVDSTNGFVFETAMSNGTYTVVVQASTTGTNSPTGTGWTALATAHIGEGDNGCNSGSTFPTHSPAFDNTYYTTPASGHMWACGAETSSSAAELWSIPFTGTGTTFGTPAGSTSYIDPASHAQCSPLTEIYNGSDFLYMGEGLSSLGRLYGFTLSGATPTAISGSPITYPSANGGTSGIIMDNVSTEAQASSIYFTTLAKSTSVCGSTSAYCAIKLTQAGLQ